MGLSGHSTKGAAWATLIARVLNSCRWRPTFIKRPATLWLPVYPR